MGALFIGGGGGGNTGAVVEDGVDPEPPPPQPTIDRVRVAKAAKKLRPTFEIVYCIRPPSFFSFIWQRRIELLREDLTDRFGSAPADHINSWRTAGVAQKRSFSRCNSLVYDVQAGSIDLSVYSLVTQKLRTFHAHFAQFQSQMIRQICFFVATIGTKIKISSVFGNAGSIESFPTTNQPR